jgi:Fe-S-cluster containining protein
MGEARRRRDLGPAPKMAPKVDIAAISEGVLKLYKESDDLLSETVSAVTEMGTRLPCKRGCHFCCYQHVVLTLGEALCIIDYLAKTPETAAVRKDLPQKLEVIQNRIEDNEYDRGPLFYEMIPCPFLHEKECAIYAVRPFVCRTYLVAGTVGVGAHPNGGPKGCDPRLGDTGILLPTLHNGISEMAFATQIKRLLNNHRIPYGLMPFPWALYYASYLVERGFAGLYAELKKEGISCERDFLKLCGKG